MAVSLPNGAVISIASTYEAADTMSALTNADPAVFTATGHGFSEDDIVEVTSGWSRLNGRIMRVAVTDANTGDLEGFDSTDTTKYPSGSGTGSLRKISAWTQITQILESTTSGGEQQFTTYAFLEDDTERQIPTTKSAQVITLQVADDQALPHYAVLVSADEARTPVAIRVLLPSGAILLYNAYVTINKTPSLTRNEVMAVQVTLSLSAEATRYAS